MQKHLEDIKAGIAAHAAEGDKHWGHVGDMQSYAASLKELSDRVNQKGEYARSADAPADEVRYSDDQPRDDNGRFGSGGGDHTEPIGQTSSGKDIPGPASTVYNEAQKMPKYNGLVSPSSAHGRDGGKMLKERLQDYTKQDHLEAYAAHTAAAAESEKKWGETVDKAAQETFGRPYSISDYKISGIASDKFSNENKDKLRDLARTTTDHKEAATAHWYAAGKHGRPE